MPTDDDLRCEPFTLDGATGIACHARPLTDRDRQAIEDFRQYLRDHSTDERGQR